MIPGGSLSLGILAGGRGQRVGGRDKAWIERAGRPALENVLSALDAPFAASLVSARAADARHAALGLVAVFDRDPGFPGPLAGLHALANACPTPWLLSLPVDVDGLPRDLAERLWHIRGDAGASVADAGGRQPLVALWHAPTLAVAAGQALAAGQGAVHVLADTLHLPVLDLSPRQLANFNTHPDPTEPGA